MDPAEFNTEVQTVCGVYLAPEQVGTHRISGDEMTGIQALERAAPSLPLAPGRVERREFEYIRHGTCTLMANLEVGTGQVVWPSLGPTRTEADFVAHIRQTVAHDPDAAWIFIVDQLNTHKSASLVEWGAACWGITEDLGEKEKRGILESMVTRAAFLADATHRIRCVYVPKHTSWLNQIECWFSILVRRLLRRGNFRSVEELQTRILAFMAYFNQTPSGSNGSTRGGRWRPKPGAYFR